MSRYVQTFDWYCILKKIQLCGWEITTISSPPPDPYGYKGDMRSEQKAPKQCPRSKSTKEEEGRKCHKGNVTGIITRAQFF